jgi:hypothetical protein
MERIDGETPAKNAVWKTGQRKVAKPQVAAHPISKIVYKVGTNKVFVERRPVTVPLYVLAFFMKITDPSCPAILRTERMDNGPTAESVVRWLKRHGLGHAVEVVRGKGYTASPHLVVKRGDANVRARRRFREE